jgi:EAL domain-containing protein (putative c-di-GMP-specific phosphodiesterase class I)
MEQDIHILVMDDEVDYANFICDVAEGMKIKCSISTTAEEFIKTLNPSFTLVFLDLNIPGTDGIELLNIIGKNDPQSNIILMSGVEDRILESAEAFAKSIGLRVLGRFQKTIRLPELEALIEKCINSIPIHEGSQPEKSISEFIVTEGELLRAIKNREFIIFYQPKIDVSTRGFYGVEALVRWQHPIYKLILPDQFIGHAESFGLIDDLSWLIYETAFEEIGNLQKDLSFRFKLSLNLSCFSLNDMVFPDKFISLIEQSKMLPESIVLEVTESGLMNELSNALAVFTRLRLKKIQLSIDDFGTGYSMMQQLKIIPANEIKIDKSFVQNIFNENSARVTVEKVIEIGHDLGMKVVAEGVETKEQLQFLQMHHCDIAQGYYFSKPIPFKELQGWIEEKYGFK